MHASFRTLVLITASCAAATSCGGSVDASERSGAAAEKARAAPVGNDDGSAPAATPTEELAFELEMTPCEDCVATIYETLDPMPGIARVEVREDETRLVVHVERGAVDAATILSTLDDAGQPARVAEAAAASGSDGG